MRREFRSIAHVCDGDGDDGGSDGVFAVCRFPRVIGTVSANGSGSGKRCLCGVDGGGGGSRRRRRRRRDDAGDGGRDGGLGLWTATGRWSGFGICNCKGGMMALWSFGRGRRCGAFLPLVFLTDGRREVVQLFWPSTRMYGQINAGV